MRLRWMLPALLTLSAAIPAQGFRDRMRQDDEKFLQVAPKIGDPLPDVRVFRDDRSEISLSDLKGNYTVLVHGCLT